MLKPSLLALSGPAIEQQLLVVLIQLCIIILSARVFANLFRRIRQPMAVGELFAGIILGPSFLGWLFPDLFARIFLPESNPFGHDAAQVLRMLSQIGLIFLLFLMGMEFDFSHLKTNVRSAIGVSITGILAPLGLGLVLGHFMHPLVAKDMDQRGFILFMGVAMSITALPMLARMMKEYDITRTRLGTITITAAASDDAAGWILLATVTALVGASFHLVNTILMVAETVGFAILVVYVAKPLLLRWVRSAMKKNKGQLDFNTLAILFTVLFLASIATILIGIFAIFGAFILGSVFSDEEEFRLAVSGLLQNFVMVFFLPIYFTYTGLRTNIGSLESPMLWFFAFMVSLVAIAGKLGGCSTAAYFSGYTPRESLCVGSMMNTRGLMELVVINVGYELGVIPPTVFSMLVMMALLTTVMTTPLLYVFMKGTELEPYLQKWNFPAKTLVRPSRE
jgi:Kef-type K+ transport system membrane component KefB